MQTSDGNVITKGVSTTPASSNTQKEKTNTCIYMNKLLGAVIEKRANIEQMARIRVVIVASKLKYLDQ